MPHTFAQSSLFDPLPLPRADHDPPSTVPSSYWSFTALTGRIVELSGSGATAAFTLACTLIREAQEQGEPVAWITQYTSLCFPPDVIEHGIDLDALVIVRVSDAASAARAADLLTRSGAFGMLVLDLGRDRHVPLALQARLVHLARQHTTLILCVTEKSRRHPSLSSLLSLRVETQRQQVGADRFRCRSEEHTSELQSLRHLVCRLL